MGNPIIPQALADKPGEPIISNLRSIISIQINIIPQYPELDSYYPSRNTLPNL